MARKTLTRKEVAERLGVTRQRVHQFIKEGRLPAQQVGPRRYIVDESDLKQLKPGKMGRPPTAGVVNSWEGCLLKEEVLRLEADLELVAKLNEDVDYSIRKVNFATSS